MMKKAIYPICFILLLPLFGWGQEQRNDHNQVLHQPPEIDFSWAGACLGDTTFFHNETIRGNTYLWYIYDKNMNVLDSSTSIDIWYVFPSADTFYISLEANNGHLSSYSQMLVIGNQLNADFNFMHCSNAFINHSTCADSFFWDFGDGITSNIELPYHQFPDTGSYTVMLIAYQGALSDTMIKQIYVDPLAFPDTSFSYYMSGDTLFIHSADSTAGIFYNWNFGDFTHLYVQDTFHVYSDTGLYILTLTIWNTCNNFSVADTVYYLNPVSVKQYGVGLSFSAYPNPVQAGDIIHIQLPPGKEKPSRILLLNATGEIMETSMRVLSKEVLIGTEDLPSGNYFISIQYLNRTSKAKFTILK